MNQSISDKAVYRTAPATPGLLKIVTKKNKNLQNLKDQIVTKLKNSNCAKLKNKIVTT